MSKIKEDVKELQAKVRKNSVTKDKSSKATKAALDEVTTALLRRGAMKEREQRLTRTPVVTVSLATCSKRQFQRQCKEHILTQLCGSMAPNPGYSRMKVQKKVDLIENALWYLYNGLFANAITAIVKKNLREEQFHPAKILREMDQKGGILSYEGVGILRSVEGAQKHC